MGRRGNTLSFLAGGDSHSKFKRSPPQTLEKGATAPKPLWLKKRLGGGICHVFLGIRSPRFCTVPPVSFLYVKDVFFLGCRLVVCQWFFFLIGSSPFSLQPLPPDTLSRTTHLGLNCLDFCSSFLARDGSCSGLCLCHAGWVGWFMGARSHAEGKIAG